MPLRRTLEISAWAGGLLLLALYFGIRAWSAQASEEGVEAMRQARAAHAAMLAANPDAGIPPTASAAPKSLSAAQPDTSTWNQKRIEEYHESLKHSATPQAVLRIPKLKLEVPVYTGTSDFVLNRGAGHIEGTAAVDSTTGNIGVAAHRDGFFRVLKDIEVGDVMYLDTITDTREYRVSRLDIVTPKDVHVLDPTPTSTVTLVTCYPFYFVGTAPERFIVRAQITQPAGS